MKKLLPLLVSLLAIPTTFLAQSGSVGIGTTTPDPNAILELSSSSKTLLLPRLKGSALAEIAGKEGMIAYDTDVRGFAGYTGAGIFVATSNNGSLRKTEHFYTSNYVTQTYTAPGTFQIQDIGIGLLAPLETTTFTLKVYDGTGITGPLLGTSNIVLPRGQRGLRYFDFSGKNIEFRKGNIYTFQITLNQNYSGIWFTYPDPYGDDPNATGGYDGGGMGLNGINNRPDEDLEFEVRGKAGRWASLATDSTLSGYVNTTTILPR